MNKDIYRREGKKPDWDEYFMGVAHAVRQRADCTRRQVGAILVKDKRIIATGYNGTPRGTKNCSEGGCDRCNGSEETYPRGMHLDKCVCSHAEENVIVQAALHGVSTKDATMYTTNSPCTTCAKMIINAGIKKIIIEGDYPDELGAKLLKEALIEIIKFGDKNA
ncbi:MAG TPA: dCMP deaminase family protein [Candidatus Aenigmarchaeota archaeon]|nr:dCMP deaminase family protein [Candidatus Aenigmarchaeota archaeon]